jgi:DNA-binding transcriptional LysR family regulator
MSELDLSALRAFVAVMQYGTVTEAALKINRTQPTTTRLISALERDLQLELFERSRQRLVPTRAAEAFYREALRILATVDDVPRITEEIKALDVSRVQVLTIPRLAESIVCPAVAEMKKVVPSVMVSVSIHSVIDLERWVVDQFDAMSLSSLPIHRADLKSTRLLSAGKAVTVPRDHPLAKRKIITPEDLCDVPLISIREGTHLRRFFDHVFRNLDFQPNVVARASNSLAALKLAAEGLGVVLIDFLAPADRFSNSITLVPLESDQMTDFGLVWRHNDHLAENARKLLKLIVGQAIRHRERLADAFGVRSRIEVWNNDDIR